MVRGREVFGSGYVCLSLTRSPSLNHFCRGVENSLKHRFGVAVDDAVALDSAGAVADVVKYLTVQCRVVDSSLDCGVGVGRALRDRGQQHAHAVLEFLAVSKKINVLNNHLVFL